jgi:transcriptional regulator with XRE-family HTH domain
MSTKKSARELLQKTTGQATFGSFLRAARTSMDMTQEQLGKVLGVSKSVICDLEKGRQTASPKLAYQIAKKAGLSEELAVQLCLQDHLRAANIHFQVDLRKAA